MKRFLYRKGFPLHILSGCVLLFLLTACGSATTTGAVSPTPTARLIPSPTTPPAKLFLDLRCQDGKNGKGGEFSPSGTHQKICVRTLPGASLTIHVTYCTGSVDQSPALKGTFTADKSGYFEWSWTPKATCQGNPPGATGFWKGDAEVTATFGGQHVTGGLNFIV